MYYNIEDKSGHQSVPCYFTLEKRLYMVKKTVKKAAKTAAKKTVKKAVKAAKYVYSFGAGKAEGNGKMKELLGGKGANLA